LHFNFFFRKIRAECGLKSDHPFQKEQRSPPTLSQSKSDRPFPKNNDRHSHHPKSKQRSLLLKKKSDRPQLYSQSKSDRLSPKNNDGLNQKAIASPQRITIAIFV